MARDLEKLPVTIRGPRLPDEPWELTAPESYLLRYGLDWDVPYVSVFKPRRTASWRVLNGSRGSGRQRRDDVLRRPQRDSVEDLDQPPLPRISGATPSRGSFDDPAGEFPGVPPTGRSLRAADVILAQRDVAGSLRNRRLLSAGKRLTAAGEEAWVQLDTWLDVSRGRQEREQNLDREVRGIGRTGNATSLSNTATAVSRWSATGGHTDDLAVRSSTRTIRRSAATGWTLRQRLRCLERRLRGGGGDGGGGDGGGERALLISPDLRFLLAHPALLNHVLLEQWHERAAVGIGDQLGRCEGVCIHLDVFETRVVQLRCKPARQGGMPQVLVPCGECPSHQLPIVRLPGHGGPVDVPYQHPAAGA